jgi:hypothetical protein
MNSFPERLSRLIPEDFSVQKLKSRDNIAAGEIGIDWVVCHPGALPPSVREIGIVKIKGAHIDVESFVRTPLKVHTLILHKSLMLPPDQIDCLKRAWEVTTVYDFHDKSRKKELKAAVKREKEALPGDFNKAVINPESSQDKKVKVICSRGYIDEALSMVLRKERPMSTVTSLKFARIDFQEMPDTFAKVVAISRDTKVGLKKCSLTEGQRAAFSPGL